MLKAYGEDPSVVPDWPNEEYDRIYVFRIRGSGREEKADVSAWSSRD